MVSHESTLDLNAFFHPPKTMMDQQCLDNFCYIWHALKLSTQLKKWYGSGCSFDIIIARWLLAVVCVCSVFFFFVFWEHSAWWQILQVTRHTLTWWQPIRYMHFTECKREQGLWDIFILVQVSKRSLCVYACVRVCVCVCKLKRYVWNRVEDNCPFPLKSSSLILLKPATEIGFLHFQIICTPYVFHHTWIFLAIYCVSAYR